MNRPFFSIVIPTRNRGHLLRAALRTALQQTFDDYEIVVSNNCSTDDTENVIAEMANDKLRAIRPDSSLSMADHWEFALPHARGEYVTYLCDDDALTPDALERTARAIRESNSPLLASPYYGYFLPTWFDETRRNAAIVTRYSGKLIERDASESLDGLYSCRISYWTPRMLNSFARRDVLDRARQRAGRLFRLSPDFSFAAAILTAVPSWVMIDRPLRLFGIANEAVGSTGAHQRDSGALDEFVRQLGPQPPIQRAPLDLRLNVNYTTETLLITKEVAGLDVELDRAQYFDENWNNIVALESNGVDVAEDKRIFHDTLAAEPKDIQEAVKRSIANERFRARRARLLPLDSWLRRRSWQLRVARAILLRGEQWGFHDIVECAEWISRPISLGLR